MEESSSRGAEIPRERFQHHRGPGAQGAEEEEGRTRSIYTWLEGVNSVRWERDACHDHSDTVTIEAAETQQSFSCW